MESRWDNIVVGAGPAGAATACWLARAGRRVALIDVTVFPRQKVCGEYLSPLAWKVLSELGLAQLRDQAVAIERLMVATPGRPAITVDLPSDIDRQPASLSRYTMDAAIVEAACAAGAQLFSEHRVRQVLIAGGQVEGITATPVHHPGETITFRAPQVIAADGRHSIVVRQTGAVRRRSAALIGFKRHIRLNPEADREFAHTIAMHALSGAYLGVCRVESGLYNVCGLLPHYKLQQVRGDIDTALRELCAGHEQLSAWLSASQPDDTWTTMPDVSLQRAEPTVAGVLYVGDAMGTIEPLTGQGMTMAMAASQCAAETLLRNPGGIDRAVQQAYARQWRTSFAGVIRTAAWFGWLLRHPRVLSALLSTRAARSRYGPRIARWAQGRLSVSACSP